MIHLDRGPDGNGISYRARVTGALLAAALIPLLAYAGGVALIRSTGPDLPDTPVSRAVLFALVGACLIGAIAALVLAAEITNPIRELAASLRARSMEERPQPGVVAGDMAVEDALAEVAERYERLAAALDRRDLEARRIQEALARLDPRLEPDAFRASVAEQARLTFGLVSADVVVGSREDPWPPPATPGEPRTVWAWLRPGFEPKGVVTGTLPATAPWAPDDQLRLDLFAAAAGLAMDAAGSGSSG